MKLEIISEPVLAIPMVILPADSQGEAMPLLQIIREHHACIIEQLTRYGAILFRGFTCQDADYFSKAIDLCGLGSRCNSNDYELPRTILPNDIYTSSDLPGHIPLPLHHEKPRSKKPPNHIYFCCVTPPDTGGGTIFANAESIWLDMPNSIQNRIVQSGVRYKQFFHGKTIAYAFLKKNLGLNSARNWQEYFGTHDKSSIEEQLTRADAEWCWKSRDLIVSRHLPGALRHPLTHKVSWFNSSAYLNYYTNLLYGELQNLKTRQYLAARWLINRDMFPMICHYGNEQPFSNKEITSINQVIRHHSRILNWQQGDFMIVDNVTFMHGKQAHTGKRLLYSCMTETHS